MRCRECGYSLLNLTEPRCPECGEAFEVTSYTFPAGAVRFACPHCGHEHEPNDDRGLISPWRFACDGCGREIDLNRTRVTPVYPDVEAILLPSGAGVPWEDVRLKGRWRRWYRTMKLVLYDPHRFYASVRWPGDVQKASGFEAATHALSAGLFLGVPLIAGGLLVLGASAASPSKEVFTNVLLSIPIGGVLAAALMVATLLVSGVAGMVLHGCVRLLAGRKGSLAVTSTIVAYGCAPLLVAWVPLFGPLGAFIWSAGLLAQGVETLHQLSPDRTRTVVAAPVLLILFPCSLIGMWVNWMVYAGALRALQNP